MTIKVGDDWQLRIAKAIPTCRYFIALTSHASVTKTRHVQNELRQALKVVENLPEDQPYILPVRLDESPPPFAALSRYDRVDLFRDYEAGLVRLLERIKPQAAIERTKDIQAREIAPGTQQLLIMENSAAARAIARLPDHERMRLRANLEALGHTVIGRQAVYNLVAEANLPQAAWESLATAIASAEPTFRSVRDAVSIACRSHLLIGPPATMPPNTFLWGVMSGDTLAHSLVHQNAFADYEAAKTFIFQLADTPDPARLFAAFKLNRYIAWATFDVAGIRPLPEYTSASEFMCVLGEQHRLAGDVLIALQYSLPPTLVPRVPTFCDAYASSVWGRSFRPASHGLGTGWTTPTDTCLDTRGRPEVVHAATTVDLRVVRVLRERDAT